MSRAVLNWIRSYLVDRVQHVVVGQAKSGGISLSTGVPQGSVLGPLLFSTFTSPVGHIISSMGIHHQQYADDTQLFISLTSSIGFNMWWWVRQNRGAFHSLLASHRGRCLVPSSFQHSPPQWVTLSALWVFITNNMQMTPNFLFHSLHLISMCQLPVLNVACRGLTSGSV